MRVLPISRALLSVTDKSGLEDFAAFLSQSGVELVSTGGTYAALTRAGLEVTPVDSVTGFPEILGGRVKTLHPHIHAGVLADKDDPTHLDTLRSMDIAPFDLVCVNLYDFARAAREGLPLKAAVEQIDIGGPTLLRAAAKNYHSVLVVPEPEVYARVVEAMATGKGGVGLELRREMAVKTFTLTSAYDAMVAEYLSLAETGIRA